LVDLGWAVKVHPWAFNGIMSRRFLVFANTFRHTVLLGAYEFIALLQICSNLIFRDNYLRALEAVRCRTASQCATAEGIYMEMRWGSNGTNIV